ncbi:hypothetical protein [Bacillus sp. OTU530]|uniref:hypothetical protein n=1 Tax=Bacillus sp. OTU530 TaxID=3043862 RepID=UPI00313AB1A1
MKPGHIEQFEEFSQFRDLKNFNDHIEMWMTDIKTEFTKSELVALKRLIRFCAKVAGVCNAKIQTIVAATHKDDVGISRSSFERMLRKAKKCGMVTIHNTFLKGKQTHNVYVFQPYPVKENPHSIHSDVQNAEKIEGAETRHLSKTNNQNINKRKEDVPVHNKSGNLEHAELNAEFVSDRVPKQFVDLAKCFWNNAKTIESLWQRVEVCAYKNAYEHDIDVKVDTGIQSLKQMVRGLKINAIRGDYKGYFYGIMQKKFEERYFEDIWEMENSCA